MNSLYESVVGFVFVVTNLCTALLYALGRSRFSPAIRDRDVHTVRKPRIGGIAMWIAIIIALFWLRSELVFGRAVYAGIDSSIWGIIGGMVILLISGVCDDIWGLKWYWQLLGQFLAALVLVVVGVTIPYIRLPFELVLQFDSFWSPVITIIWVVSLINVMNWFDGLDGLAGSVAMTASLALFFVSLRLGVTSTALLSLILFGAAAGFLIWNWYPSKLFMGTVGSQLLGFLLAVIAIISGGKVATAILVLGIPVLDAVIVVFRRLKAGKSLFTADQRHLHHRLLKIGLSTPWVVILINAVAALFAFLAVPAQGANTKGLLTLFLLLCMTAFILITYLLERRSEKRVH